MNYQFSRRGTAESDSSGEKAIALTANGRAVLSRSPGLREISYSIATYTGETAQRNRARVSAVVSAQRLLVETDPYASSPCDPAKAQLRSDLADLALPMAGRISVGQRWTDSLTNDICVGGVPGRGQAWRQFEAVGDTALAGERTVIVVRTDSLSADAAGTLDQHVLSLTGAGHTSVRLYVSETSGKILRATKEQLLNITVISAGRTKRFTQMSTSVAEIFR